MVADDHTVLEVGQTAASEEELRHLQQRSEEGGVCRQGGRTKKSDQNALL